MGMANSQRSASIFPDLSTIHYAITLYIITLKKLLKSTFGNNNHKYKSTDLHPNFGQIHFHRQFFSRIDIGIMAFLEGPLQFVQLVRGEGRPIPAVLLFVRRRARRRILVAARRLVFGRRLEAVVAVARAFTWNKSHLIKLLQVVAFATEIIGYISEKTLQLRFGLDVPTTVD